MSKKRKPLFRGLSLLVIFLLCCALPFAYLRFWYKFNFVSRELILLFILDLLLVLFWTNKAKKIKFTVLHFLLFLAAIQVILANLTAPHLLAVLVLYLLLFLLFIETISGEYFFIWIAWSSILSTILSIYQHWSMAYGVVPAWLKLSSHGGRMSGLLAQPNLTACLVVVGLFAWHQVLWLKYGRDLWRWYYQIPMVIFVWGLLLTGSKAGMLAFVSALLLLGWGLVRNREIKLLKFFSQRFVWSIILGVILFFIIQPPLIENFGVRAIDFSEESTASGSRLIYLGAAIVMGFEHVWTGVGLGGFRRLLGGHMVSVAEWLRVPYDSIQETLWAHNDFLHIFAECGVIVSLVFFLLFIGTLLKLSPGKNLRSIFCFCAIWSFFVLMQFGHPFNDHVLVFYLVLLAAGAYRLSPIKFQFEISKKIIFLALIPCLFIVNYNVLSHAFDMYRLKEYLQNVVTSAPLTVGRLISLRDDYQYHLLISDPLFGWEFEYAHLQALGNYAVKHDDLELASFLIEEFEHFKSEHSSPVLTFQLSRLNYMVNDYKNCKLNADEAFLLKPDMYHYSNFGHICLVFDISRREKIPVPQLLGKKYFSELKKQKIIKMDKLDGNLCAL